MKLFMFIFCFSFLIVGNARADVVYLKSGKQVSGQVTENSEERVTVLNDNGQFVVDKEDVLYIKKELDTGSEKDKKKSLFQSAKTFWIDISTNNFSKPRKLVRKYHLRLFSNLQRLAAYRYIADNKMVADYRGKNPKAFKLAVYMVLLLILGFVLKFIKSVLVIVWCKIFRIKERYDL